MLADALLEQYRPVDDGLVHRLTQRPREHWVKPIPDVMALPAESDADPAERARLPESIRLALVAALQYLHCGR